MEQKSMSKKKLKFYKPLEKLKELLIEFKVDDILSLPDKLRSPKCKDKRELFYGIIFTECLHQINQHEYLIRLPDEDTDCDFEILDMIQYRINQPLNKNEKFSDHWRCQNVMITEHPVKEFLSNGTNNIYDIFSGHLYKTKLSPQKGDYLGCILIFYFNLKIDGRLDLYKIRKSIRNIKQNKVQQIYIIIPYLKGLECEFTIAEILLSDYPAITVDFSKLLKNLNQ